MESVCMEVKVLVGILLCMCSITDMKQKTIPMSYVKIGFVLLVVLTLFHKDMGYLCRIKGMAIGGMLYVLGKVTKGQIGEGDGLLFCLTGLGLGFWYNFYLLFLSLLTSAVFCGFMLVQKKMSKKQTIPFVPFILIGYIGVLFG